MRPLTTTVLLCQFVLLASGARAEATEGRLEQLFPRQAPLTVEGDGMARLVLPPDVLAASQPDLSDVRIVDAQGGQVPYLVDSGWSPEKHLEVTDKYLPRSDR